MRPAAEHFARAVQQSLAEREHVAAILDTGSCQPTSIRAVRERDDIDWSRLAVLHMDNQARQVDRVPVAGDYRLIRQPVMGRQSFRFSTWRRVRTGTWAVDGGRM